MEKYQEDDNAAVVAFRAAIDEIVEYNRQIDELAIAIANGEAGAVKTYFEWVFQRSEYPEGFPTEHKIGYAPDSNHLVIDLQLPTLDDIVPKVEKFKYIKSTREISEMKKSERVQRNIYLDAISSSALRTLHEAFAADKNGQIQTVTINAFVSTMDSGTGQSIQPYLLSVRANRDEFKNLALRNIEPAICLKRLSATVSRSPAELVRIKPIVDIDLFDPRFIDEQDVISTLDTRPNLMMLSPSEF